MVIGIWIQLHGRIEAGLRMVVERSDRGDRTDSESGLYPAEVGLYEGVGDDRAFAARHVRK